MAEPVPARVEPVRRSASWAPGLLALRPARHLFWLLDHHTRPTAGHTRATIGGPAAGRCRPAAVEIATSSPPADIEAR